MTASRSHWPIERDAPRRVLILVENLPVPFDRRVWQEACALRDSGYVVSVACPTGPGCERRREVVDGIHIHRYRQFFEASGPAGYAVEYATALMCSLAIAIRVALTRGIDVVHACNPPDLFFLIGGLFKLFGKKFVFDHHDINPELYEAKFQRRDFFYRLMVKLEYLTFRTADAVISTNESYRRIAISRGGVPPSQAFIVRSGPTLERMKIAPPDPALKQGRRFLVGYVGVMGDQEGIDCLLRVVRHIVFELLRDDIHFALVGSGTALERMKTLAHRFGVAGHVTFTGRVPDEAMLRVLNTADLCVNPDPPTAMNDKSTMNKIMEYMALGKPIVQFELTEGRFSAREASLYARANDARDFAEKILALLDDPAMRERMGEFGRHRVERQLAWEYEAPKLLAAYEALFVKTPAPAGSAAATEVGYPRGYGPRRPRSSPEP
jgi:glycosyltransferase involved in cell wall biosynthesis